MSAILVPDAPTAVRLETNGRRPTQAIRLVTESYVRLVLAGSPVQCIDQRKAEKAERHPAQQRFSRCTVAAPRHVGDTRNWEQVATVHLNPEKGVTEAINEKEEKPELKKAA